MTNQADFITFLQSLAPEGETPLLVLQRPRRDDPSQYTFPAMFPSGKIPEGAAVFANTASYVIERLDPRRPSASLANADSVLVMMLDDIGQKVGEPPVQPTWKIETSLGSFQWGYAFSELPSVGDFAAAIKALADAGFTDPGAVNAARNFRIPGSVNLKPGRDLYVSQLREFHPERKFTLPELVAAFGVKPGERSATLPVLGLHDDGSGDEVFQWLLGQRLVLSKPNGEGWASVVCPNHAQHTNESTEGRYHPGDRGYKCLHAHCQHITSDAYLEWVGENGGPRVSVGVRSELLSEKLKAAIDKLPKPETPNALISEIETQERQRLERAEWFDRYAYVESDDCFFDLQYRRTTTRAAFNALYRHVICKSVKTDRICEASIWFDENRMAMGAKSLAGLTYAAGEGALVAQSGQLKGNFWTEARPVVNATHSQDVSLWMDLCRTLVPNADELDHMLNVMAFKVQNPKVKINHAVLHMGDEGCGKDTMWAPFLWAVCGSSGQNRAIVNGGELSSQWGYAYESEVLVLNELHEPEASQRRALANKLKPLIAAPPDTISVNRKMLRPYDAANRLFVLAFSNEAVPISISSQDRRWFVVRSTAGRLAEDRATRLWTWYRAEGGLEAIALWLHTRDVSKFNPAVAPMMTEDKASMIEGGMTSGEDYLCGQALRRQGEFARGVVGSRWSAVVDRLQATAPQGVKINKHALFHAMKEAKWVNVGRIMSSKYTTKVDVWCAPDMAHMSKSELRELVEPAQLPAKPVLAFPAKG